MITVFGILFPVFALGALGYAAARVSAFPPAAMDGMNRYVFNVAAPVTVIRVLASADLPPTVPWDLLGAFYVPLFLSYFLMLAIGTKVLRDPAEGVMLGFGSCYGNLVLIGLPVTMLVFGDAGLVPYFILLPLHGVSLMALTAVLIEAVRHGGAADRGALARQIVLNPFVAGVGGGLLLRQFGVTLTGPVDQAALALQQSLTPCALFVLGVSIAERGVAGHWQRALVLVAAKNVVLPFAVFLAGTLVFSLPPLWLAVAVLTAAQPIGVLYFVFAARFGASTELAASAVSLSTLFTLASLPVLVWWFQTSGLI